MSKTHKNFCQDNNTFNLKKFPPLPHQFQVNTMVCEKQLKNLKILCKILLNKALINTEKATNRKGEISKPENSLLAY